MLFLFPVFTEIKFASDLSIGMFMTHQQILLRKAFLLVILSQFDKNLDLGQEYRIFWVIK